MKIKVLGCSGSEMPGFGPPAFLIDGSLLLDAGTINSSLDQISQNNISHVLVSHAHLDHIRGLASLIDNIFFINKGHSVTVAGDKKVLDTIKKHLFNDSVWPDFTCIPDKKQPALKMKHIKMGKSFRLNCYRVIAEKVNHPVNATGFIIEDRKGKKLLYTGDTGPTEALWERANMKADGRGIDGAILEVTFPNRMKGSALKTGHLTPAMLKEDLKKLENLPEKIFITHTKPQFFNTIKREIRKLGIRQIAFMEEGKTYRI